MKSFLGKFRFEAGVLSQQELANLVGVSWQTDVSIEKGDHSPSVKLALLLAENLGTNVELLFLLEEKDHA